MLTSTLPTLGWGSSELGRGLQTLHVRSKLATHSCFPEYRGLFSLDNPALTLLRPPPLVPQHLHLCSGTHTPEAVTILSPASAASCLHGFPVLGSLHEQSHVACGLVCMASLTAQWDAHPTEAFIPFPHHLSFAPISSSLFPRLCSSRVPPPCHRKTCGLWPRPVLRTAQLALAAESSQASHSPGKKPVPSPFSGEQTLVF
jgi:hypothetical protein